MWALSFLFHQWSLLHQVMSDCLSGADSPSKLLPSISCLGHGLSQQQHSSYYRNVLRSVPSRKTLAELSVWIWIKFWLLCIHKSVLLQNIFTAPILSYETLCGVTSPSFKSYGWNKEAGERHWRVLEDEDGSGKEWALFPAWFTQGQQPLRPWAVLKSLQHQWRLSQRELASPQQTDLLSIMLDCNGKGKVVQQRHQILLCLTSKSSSFRYETWIYDQ